MEIPERIEPFWSAFLTTTGRPRATPLYEVFHFGDSEALATSLADLVRRGEKTATASLLWECEAEGTRPPQAGDLSVVPNEILGQFGNRIQHALRAYTPRDQKAVRTAAETFMANPRLDVAAVISQLAIGEALVSTLQDTGVPMPVERALVCPPRCRMGAITPDERAAVRGRSPIGAKYDTAVNRESAYEILSRRAAPAEPGGGLGDLLWGTKRRQGMVEAMAKQAARTVGSQIGRQILRGALGGILGGSRRR